MGNTPKGVVYNTTSQDDWRPTTPAAPASGPSDTKRIWNSRAAQASREPIQDGDMPPLSHTWKPSSRIQCVVCDSTDEPHLRDKCEQFHCFSHLTHWGICLGCDARMAHQAQLGITPVQDECTCCLAGVADIHCNECNQKYCNDCFAAPNFCVPCSNRLHLTLPPVVPPPGLPSAPGLLAPQNPVADASSDADTPPPLLSSSSSETRSLSTGNSVASD